jgi:hypothetical protein
MKHSKSFIAKLKEAAIHIKCENAKEKRAVSILLASIGERVSGFGVGEIDMGYPYVYFAHGEWDGSRSSTESISFAEFASSIYANSSVDIKLNDSYTASFEYGNDYVTVGCQRFKVSKIRELLKEIDNLS